MRLAVADIGCPEFAGAWIDTGLHFLIMAIISKASFESFAGSAGEPE